MFELAPEIPPAGFNFDNCLRNLILDKKGFKGPQAKKTGTTIAGCIFKDGLVLGADTRATSGNIVADKNCEKIHRITDRIFCCGAGTAADTAQTTDKISAQLKLHELNTGRIAPVAVANTKLKQLLFRYQGYISAYLVLGGVDNTGPHIYCIFAHGSSAKLPYTTMGSGSLAAMAVFESRWKPDMELEDAKTLVKDAISAGIFNDLGSGSNVDLCVITKQGSDYLRGYDQPNEKLRRNEKELKYKYAPGVTPILSEITTKYDITEEVVERMEE